MGAPSHGELVTRERCLAAVESLRPHPVVLYAPAGYGKSALALQYAGTARFRSAVWLRVGGAGFRESTWVRLLSVAGVSRLETQDYALEAVLKRLEWADARNFAEVCVVLDDAPVSNGAIDSACVQIATALQELGAQVVLTAGGCATVRAVQGSGLRLLDSDELRMSTVEASTLSSVLGANLADDEVLSLSCACSGHVGLFTQLVRLAATHDGQLPEQPSASLSAYVSELEAQLTTTQRCLFATLCLMSSGTLTDVREVVEGVSREDILAVAETIPLIRARPDLPVKFSAHELIQNHVVGDDQLVRSTAPFSNGLLGVLCARGMVARAAAIAPTFLGREALLEWLTEFGLTAVASGAAAHVEQALDALSVRELIEWPYMLLLQSRAFLETGRHERALEKAKALLTLLGASEASLLRAEALLAVADCQCAAGDNAARRTSLTEAIRIGASGLQHHALVNAHLELAAISAYDSSAGEVLEHLTRAEIVADAQMNTACQQRVRLFGGAVSWVARGNWTMAATCFSGAAELVGNTISEKVRFLGNASVAYCETGRATRSMRLSTDALQLAKLHGIESLEETFAIVRAAVMMAEQADSCAIDDISDYLSRQTSGDRQSFEYNRVYCATMLRALHRHDESLLQAERALEVLARVGDSFVVQLAVLEVAASLVTVGDCEAAQCMAAAQRAALDHANSYHLLRADMILAEIERREGDVGEAVERLAGHSEYILTESSNWQIAMYVRAFPELLGLFAKAIPVGKLPTHLLRMIPPETAEVALASSRELLGEERWCALGTRLFGEDEFVRWRARDGRPLCRIRLFGGLDVSVGGRRIPDKDWRKRKSRLLFAMLAIRRGQDVAREQLGEYLWPEMDEVRARNNLYVTWNAMKSVLMGGQAGPCPYIENKGGLYRLVADNVRTDVEDFETWLAKAVAAEKAGDNAKALDAYRRAADLYRGDLLPGDLYDDWFAATRDQYRAEYCNAMLRASDWLMSIGDPSTAGSFARRGINVDPYREDLYRSALRAQIATGQRGAAVDTYLQCRAKLVDDLGLDPSEETRSLYDEVLAMDGRPPRYPFDPLAE